MKVTADTITTEQIHAVRKAMLGVPRKNAYHRAILVDCGAALDGNRACRESAAAAYNKMLGLDTTAEIPLTDPQREMLVAALRMEHLGKKPERFAPNGPVARALKRRGFVTVSYIGQRWWRIQLTRAGRDLARTLIPDEAAP